MPRKKLKQVRSAAPDALYQSELVSRLINCVMWDGKKMLAQRIVYKAMEELGQKADTVPLRALEMAIANIKPPVEVRSRRVGGATYQVPGEVRPERQLTLALRWLVRYARQRREHSMEMKLGRELVDAFNQTGAAVKKRTDTLKMAEANKAFAHYRW